MSKPLLNVEFVREISCKDIAIDLVVSGSDQQAEFFLEFARRLSEPKPSGWWPFQAQAIVDELTPEQRVCLKNVLEEITTRL